MNSGKRILGIFYLLLTAIIWGGSFISQLAGQNIGSGIFNVSRCIFSSLTCFIIVYINNLITYKKFCFFKEDDDKLLIIKNAFICGATLFFGMMSQQIGAERTDVAKAGLIASIEVICVPILMLILYKKRIAFVTWIFIITSMLGIMLLSVKSVTGINDGDIWVFVSTIIYSITIIQIPKYCTGIDPFVFSFFRMLTCGILSFIYSIIFERNIFDLHNIYLAMPNILYAGVLSSGIAYILQILGQKYCEPVIATLIMCLEGVFAAIFGWILLGQTLNFLQLIGCIIAIVSICIVQITDYYEEAKIPQNLKK